MVFAPNQIYDKLVLSRQFLHPDKYAAKWYFSLSFIYQQPFLKMQLYKFSSDLK